jgi:hypothetical protein
MGFTCGTFDLKLVILDVADCVRDSARSQERSSKVVHAAGSGATTRSVQLGGAWRCGTRSWEGHSDVAHMVVRGG